MNALSYPSSRRKARKLMREAGVQVKYRQQYQVTTNGNPKQPMFDNVPGRNFAANQPNQAYVGDITCIGTQVGCTWLW